MQKPLKPGVSVVIVSYNTREQLARCLHAVEAHHQIIVVDNASSDGSPQMVRQDFPSVVLIENEQNVGFGAANNLGMTRASRGLTLFLNSDAYASPGAIDLLADQFKDLAVSGAGGRLLNPDMSLQNSTARSLSLLVVFAEQLYIERFMKLYWTTNPKWTSPTPVDQLMGACLMIRTGSAHFDERFFLYCEDSDLCERLKSMGRLLYVPGAEFVHELGSSSKSAPWVGIARYNRGKELYFQIHASPLTAGCCFALNRLGAFLRLIAHTLALHRLKNPKTYSLPVKTWWKVLTAPLLGPPRPDHTEPRPR